MKRFAFCQGTLLFVVNQIIAFSQATHMNHHWTCAHDINFQYNRCEDPAHPHITFSIGNQLCNTLDGDKQNLIRITKKMRDYLQNKMTIFDTEHIRCEPCLQQLQRTNLTDILGIENSNEFESENFVTTTYMKLTQHLRLFHKLWCLYSSRAEQQCSLPFSQTFYRLKNRILSKWWNIQNNCGQTLEHFQCETSVPAFSNTDLRCEDIRNIIYILLRDSHSLLTESLAVVDRIRF